jgi:TM2 domain-containing membrane protein YozV
MMMTEPSGHYLFPLRRLVQTVFVCFLSLTAFSQSSDTTEVEEQTEAPALQHFPDSIFRFNVKKPIPKRAGLYSACLPGLGQLYNKQYWKAGLVYAGTAVITGFLISNYDEYNKYRKIYIGMIDSNPETPDTYLNYTVDDVKYLRDGFRKYLEYSILSAGLGYMLNILDAFISAHLKSFDMSKDISFHTTPVLNHQKQICLQVGFYIK